MRSKLGISRVKGERGLSLVEVLVAAALLAIVGVGITRTSIMMTSQNSQTIYRSVATELALDRLEELATVNPELLSDANDTTETLTYEGLTFTRTVDVTIRPNRARHVQVTVAASAPGVDISVELQNSFALWGRR